jgi:hypothetical protein
MGLRIPAKLCGMKMTLATITGFSMREGTSPRSMSPDPELTVVASTTSAKSWGIIFAMACLISQLSWKRDLASSDQLQFWVCESERE